MKRFIERIHSTVLCLLLVLSIGASFCACQEKENSYFGDINYGAPVSAMVFENIDGEQEKGIVYREINDIRSLINDSGMTVCLYVYNSLSDNDNGITALTEDLAQALDGSVLFISVDSLSGEAVYSEYGITSIPGYVLLKNGQVISVFDGSTYDYWGTDEVISWLEVNGYGI